MKIKGIVEEDFINFFKPSMLLLMPSCDWKCGKELCQNSEMALAPVIEVEPADIAARYVSNPITKAFIFSGLEPLMSFEDVVATITELRKLTNDDIIIYTGYTESEIAEEVKCLCSGFKNIIIKFGRFIPNEQSHKDDVLQVSLASFNQYAKKIC